MRLASLLATLLRPARSLFGVGLLAAGLGATSNARAQELPRVSVQRPLRVGGVVAETGEQDLIGLSRVEFQGLIAAELTSVGYRIESPNDDDAKRAEPASPRLTLVGYVKEEICDDEAPSQCRIAIQWELQDPRGVVAYRVITRAVEQKPNIEKLRRGLIEGALRSLLQRRRFALQLTEESKPSPSPATGALGFKQCRRAPLELPRAARAAAASLVLVESGSNLAAGAIVSGDGLILTAAGSIEASAPLRVRFSAEQTVPARVVALDRNAGVALLHVAAHTEGTCLVVRDAPLPTGQAVFGIGSELGEDRAMSLVGGVVQETDVKDDLARLFVDPLLARAPGGALLDAEGRLAAVVTSAAAKPGHGAAQGLGVAAALAALGFAVSATGSLRERDSEFAVLRALGAPRRRLARTIAVEQGVLVTLALLVGAALGTVLARAVIPLILLTSDAARPVPEVLVELPLGQVALLLAAVAATPLAVTAVLALRRANPLVSLRQQGGE